MIFVNFNIVPTSGCQTISNCGTCYSYFSSTGINWEDARLQCATSGYDLATVTSVEENTLMYNTAPANSRCWLGLNDIDNEGTFVWVDGSVSTYRRWNTGEPNDNYSFEDCVEISTNSSWNDFSCTNTQACYFCSTKGEDNQIQNL